MANPDHLERLQQGVKVWNTWRNMEPWIKPDLREASLDSADLRKVNFCGANLEGVRLGWANLRGADLSGADLRKATLLEANLSAANLHKADFEEADLRRADVNEATFRSANFSWASLVSVDFHRANLERVNFRGARLSGADLKGAKLRGAVFRQAGLRRANFETADLREADFRQADLHLANLVDTVLDRADLTDATLWETQRSGWSIRGVVCLSAYWDEEGFEPTKYGEGEFERIFAEKPRIVLRYLGGMSPVDLLALPFVVERLQVEHPGSVLQVRSVQNDGGGASVTITVEDLTDRRPEASRQELVRIQAKLECFVEERDHLRQSLEAERERLRQIMNKLLERPTQKIDIHRPRGLTAIEGPNMSRDTYNIPGQAGAVGSGASAHGNIFQQVQGGIDLAKLAEELGRLRVAMKGDATGTREQDKAIGAVADAEEAAAKGDGPAALGYLKSAGKWTLGIAEKIGVALATEALKRVI
ncbi:pentapeptide repeat-containing protein [Dankookia sp. GCM10030260]|uniref:pentapeptide repeat-containing protein n=1 Tax=Dankookia sp. GCM10030260 TaxID=3273390 RepID=UPI0036072D03